VKKLIVGINLMLALLMTADTFADKPDVPATPSIKTDKADDAAIIASLHKTLSQRLPKLHIDKIQPSQWPFFYEVVTDGELFYVDKTGEYLFYGKVMNTQTREDLTEARWNALNQVDFNTLPLNLALKEVKGNGSRRLAVFADPHCPFCTRFEKTLRDMDNVTVYTFLYPLEGLHPGATERAKLVWCANDRLSAWHDWMLSQKDTPATACNTGQMDTVKQLGEKLKINGTPTLIFEDGHRIPGAIGKDDLEQEFKKLEKKS
jgi:thiol:disulfide interchange protein DsbC